MKARLIDAVALRQKGYDVYEKYCENPIARKAMLKIEKLIVTAPTVDALEVDVIRKWLYEIAENNVGVEFNGDFSDACEEIISRLDGLKKFAKEYRENND